MYTKQDVADIGTAEARAIGIYKQGVGVRAGASASIVKMRQVYGVNVHGWRIEAGASLQLGALGANAEYYVGAKGFQAKTQASLGVGAGFIVRIVPPQ